MPAAASVLRIAYVSTSVGPMDSMAFADLLLTSRARNQRLGIFGTLMLYDGCFMHAMEGPADAIEQLMAAIRHDRRHHSIWMLINEADTRRRMPPWPLLSGPRVSALSAEWLPGQAATTPALDQALLTVPCIQLFALMQRLTDGSGHRPG